MQNTENSENSATISYRKILEMAYPLILSTTSYTIMRFIDRMFLSWNSQEDIEAVVPASMLSFMFIAFFIGTASYANALLGQYFGAGKPESFAKVFFQGWYFSVFSTIIILMLIPFGHYLILKSGHSQQVVDRELIYFNWSMYTGGVIVFNNFLSAFFSSQSKTFLVMIVNFIGCAISVFLDYHLIFGHFGFPQLGILGAGVSAFISMISITVMYLFLIFATKQKKNFPLRTSFQFQKNLFLQLIRFGVPSGIQFALDVGSFACFIFLVGQIGATALAASNILFTIEMLVFLPLVGLGIATSVLVGQSVGRKRYDNVYLIVRKSFTMAVAYVFLAGFFLFSFNDRIVDLFHQKNSLNFEEIAKIAVPMVSILFLFILADSMVVIFSFALKGAGDTQYQMWSSLWFTVLFFMPGVWSFVNFFHWPVMYCWLGVIGLYAILGAIFFQRFYSQKWENIHVIED